MRVVHPFPQAARARLDAGFLDPRYPGWRRQMGLPPAEHPGADYNLSGTAGDGDLGYPVVAVAEGVVTHVKAHRVWGWIVLIEHPRLADLLGYPRLFSQYAHLLHPCVEEGQSIWAGEPIGSVGKGDPARPFAAHLHFEIRQANIPADHWPGSNKAAIQRDYLDPEAFLKRHMAYERRFIRQGLLLWLPSGKRTVSGETIINLEDDALAQVRIKTNL